MKLKLKTVEQIVQSYQQEEWVYFEDAIKAANESAEIWQEQTITLHKILYKILNEDKPTYTVGEQEKIKQIIDEHLI